MYKIVTVLIFTITVLGANSYSHLPKIKFNTLTPKEEAIIVYKGTEAPFSGKYYNHHEDGTYSCKRCGAALYKSDSKFDSHCGWPSFDDEIKGAIKRVKDKDGIRTEITCARCGAHLGHVFVGEGFTEKNIRHCVNSASLNFEPADSVKTKKAYFAGGCFWGVEYYLEKLDGVVSVVSGYMGGTLKNPSYRDVSHTESGHLEVVEVTYDAAKVSYEALAKHFFEIHDATQANGQGPDIGSQYLSAIFVSNEKERKIVQKLITILKAKGINAVTMIKEKSDFYKAEEYHQDYYEKHHKRPYCHAYKKIF